MAKKEIIIQRFDGGISDDIRQNTSNSFAITKHFDIYTNPHRLTPHRSTEADTNDGSTGTGMKQYKVFNFQLGSDGKLYGIGIQPASTTRTKIVSKTDPTDGNWTLNATAEGGLNGSESWRDSFMEWGTAPAFWMFGGTTSVSKWVIGGTFTDTVATVGATIVHVAQSVKAPDNNMYMFYNAKVVRVTPSGTVTDAVLALPTDGRITNACLFGNYMAIAWASGTTLTSGGRSKLFLWDLVSSDITESIDMGEGQLMVVGNIEGRLVGVSDLYLSSTIGNRQGSIVIRMYSGGTPVIVKEIQSNNTQDVIAGVFIRNVVIKQNKMYWVMAVPFNTSTSTTSTQNLGIWAFGRKDINSNFALSLDYIEEAVDTVNFNFKSFGNAGNYWFINHSADGSITKTNDQTIYTFTSFYESQKFNGGDISKTKRLVGVSVSTVPLPTNGQVVLKYKRDSESSFKTIYTNTTDNSVFKEAVTIESTGNNLGDFQEVQFRIESTGGAEITGLKFIYDDSPKNILTTK